jgi:hypothetical protein
MTNACPKVSLPGVKSKARITGRNTSVAVRISTERPDPVSS